jgi:hypothetical protein
MDICKVLSGFNPVSPSDFNLSNEAINSEKFPNPALFFTWYCEKAREIEKYTGSVEFSLKLLELALENLPSNSRIAKRFILATRHSLLRYQAHINSLAAKLEEEKISSEEKASILQTLRTIDLKTFELGSKKSAVVQESVIESISDSEGEEQIDIERDWNNELEILDLILQDKISDAFGHAQKSIFFPSALLDNYSPNPTGWLKIYCKTLAKECYMYFETVKKDPIMPLSPEMCEDSWTVTTNAYLGTSHEEEQIMSLILTKCQMALKILQTQKNMDKFCNDESYF